MRFELLQEHINRRQLLGGIGKAGAVGAAVAAGVPGLAGAAGAQVEGEDGAAAAALPDTTGAYDDSFSIEGALNGDWARETSARYGPDDQRGTLNEITPQKTARSLAILAGARRVDTYSLGHVMRDGFPAYRNFPPRVYSQRTFVLGFQPEDVDEWFTAATPDDAGYAEWREEDLERGPLGYLVSPEPLGANQVSSCEERFLHGGTYQIGTQFDNFPHFGVGDILYNGFKGSEIATPTGFSKLGMENVGPFITRGLLLDVLGWKKSQGSADVQTINGHDMLTDTYRITVDDLRATMRWEGISSITPGDVVLIRTGWWWLAEDGDPASRERYLASHPGIYLAEAKFLGDHRPALIGSDAWALEVVGHPTLTQWVFPVHTELLVRRGIHIGESIITHDLAERRIYRFVYSYSPQRAWGATAGNAPPVAMTRG